MVESALLPLMYSIPFEKHAVHVTGYFEGGRFLLVTGHRRILATRLLGEKRIPGYFAEMEIDALEIKKLTWPGQMP